MDDEDNRLQKIITETFQNFFNSRIMAPLLELLRASEQRIDDTNKMIQRLSEICEHYTTLTANTSHPWSVQETRRLIAVPNLSRQMSVLQSSSRKQERSLTM